MDAEGKQDDAGAEIQRLQGCIDDLISVHALPALWKGRGSTHIVGTLLDALGRVLRLEFAYARLDDPDDEALIEMIRSPARAAWPGSDPTLDALRAALTPGLVTTRQSVRFTVPHPAADGHVSMQTLPLGLQDKNGVVALGSRRADFPTRTEMLIFHTATNLAVIALEEVRRLGERHRAAQELERRVAERTDQLAAANAELRKEIAERENAEGEQRKLASLVENCSDFIGIASLEGRVRFINRAGRRLVGLEGDESGRAAAMLEFVSEEDRDGWRQQVLPAVLREGTWDGEMRFRHFGTKATIPMMQHFFLIKDPRDDRPAALGIIGRDISLRKRAQSDLVTLKYELTTELNALTRLHELSTRFLVDAELQPRLQEVLDATMDLLRADFGSVQIYNPRTQSLEVVVQRGFAPEVVDHFNRVPEATATCGVALQRRQRAVVEDVQAEPSCGPHLEIAATAGYRAVQSTPLFTRGGDLLGVISTHFREPHRPLERELRFIDLYARQAAELIERERAEAALRASEETLRKLQTEIAHVTRMTTMGELAASIAHEINQPLGAIVNNSNVGRRLLATIPAAPAELSEVLADIIHDANRASDIITRIRHLVRKTAPEKISLHIREVVADVLALARRELVDRRIIVQTDFPRDLPEVSGDRVQLQQVLLNLVMNGIEAMSSVVDERRLLRIVGQHDQIADQPMVRISVCDAGVGIIPDDLDRLFEAFYTTKSHGLGMGLRISRSIIEAHGGRLWAAPNAGPGATFYCALPVAYA